MVTHVFVYGTLRMGEPWHNLLAPYTTAVQPATLHGAELYWASDWYPGLVKGTGTVTGELAELDPLQMDAVLEVLDEFENYHGPGDPANQYEREVITVKTNDGARRDAWVYVWLRKTEDSRRIPEGDWAAVRPRA